MDQNPVRVWGDIYSGNCYKIKLALKQLCWPYEWNHVHSNSSPEIPACAIRLPKY